MSDFKIEEIRKQLEDLSIKPKINSTDSSNNEFSNIIEEAIVKVNQEKKEAGIAKQNFISGENTNLHETLLSLEKADLSFKLMMSVRTKLVGAYKEIMRTSV